MMMEYAASEAVRAYALAQVGGPYVYGATARACTPAYRRQRIEQYPEYREKIEDNCPVLSGDQEGCDGCRYEGRLAHDCAQLTRFAANAAGLSLPSGATSQWNKADWAAKGEIGTLPEGAVCFLFRRQTGSTTVMSHVGVSLGDGTAVDARGHDDGVVHRKLGSFAWTHWAILRGMACPDGLADEEAPAGQEVRPVLRRGSSGEAVRQVQSVLRRCGYSLEVDGVFGSMTQQAVLSFQGTRGLKRDGVVGALTWAALDAADKAAPACWTVTIPGLTEAVAGQIVREHGGRMEQEGNA